MASILELIIVKEQIFEHPSGNEIDNRSVNASFAMAASVCKINCMTNHVKGDVASETENVSINERLDKMINDHKLWLETKSLNELPIIINAQYYEFLEIIHTFPLQILGF
jgi:hypothetical protein